MSLTFEVVNDDEDSDDGDNDDDISTIAKMHFLTLKQECLLCIDINYYKVNSQTETICYQ